MLPPPNTSRQGPESLFISKSGHHPLPSLADRGRRHAEIHRNGLVSDPTECEQENLLVDAVQPSSMDDTQHRVHVVSRAISGFRHPVRSSIEVRTDTPRPSSAPTLVGTRVVADRIHKRPELGLGDRLEFVTENNPIETSQDRGHEILRIADPPSITSELAAVSTPDDRGVRGNEESRGVSVSAADPHKPGALTDHRPKPRCAPRCHTLAIRGWIDGDSPRNQKGTSCNRRRKESLPPRRLDRRTQGQRKPSSIPSGARRSALPQSSQGKSPVQTVIRTFPYGSQILRRLKTPLLCSHGPAPNPDQ